ncbi:MAG: NYN domain-containing protein [Deltaproteobacteria bacterium]|nr:NYN domain-containing protein [Deltaproteobacteria bacterium]
MTHRIVIDGYNVLGQGADAGLRDIEAGRDNLISRLLIYKKVRRVKLAVVFDGTRSGNLAEGRESRAGIDVIFSRDGVDADTVIKRMAGERGEGLTVVTSDRGLASYCAGRGAVVVSSAEFEGILDAAAYEELKGVIPEDEEDAPVERKGQSKRLPKAERKKRRRLKKM